MIKHQQMKIYKDEECYSLEEIKKLRSQTIFCGNEYFAAATQITGNEDKITFLKKYCIPPLGAEEICDEFNKYGHTVSGIADGWVWDENKLNLLTEGEVWKMVALANIYWNCREICCQEDE